MLGAGLPDGVKQPVKPHAGRHPLGKPLISRHKRRQRGAHMGVAAGLGPGQGAGVSAQVRQVRRKGLRNAHGMAPSARKEKLRKGTYASQKSSVACRNHSDIRTFGTWGRELAWGRWFGN